MAKRRSPARALFQLQEPCCCCLDASRRTVRCACGLSYCESCLHEVIHQWVVDQDETNPDSSLISPADLDDASEGLPPPIINNLRYRSLSSRAKECSHCCQRTLCPPCAVSAYHHRCELCKSSQVCPKCVTEGVLVGNPFREGEEGTLSASLASTSRDTQPIRLWRCQGHASMSLQE